MNLFPQLPMHDSPTLGDAVFLAPEPTRSHLVPKAPTGEPLHRAVQVMTQEQRIKLLEARVERLERYLESQTWTARWRRLTQWVLSWRRVRP